MQGALAANADYLIYVLACVILFGLLECWLRVRQPRGHLSFATWPMLAALLITGWFMVDGAGRAERQRIQGFLEGIAPTYALELARLGHAGLTLSTPPDDPVYLTMIEATKRWKQANPAISDVYTFRRDGDAVRLIVASETDYNHNGRYEGEREQRVPLGKEYPQADPNMLRALDGAATFSSDPVRDEWGVWVSAQVPLFNQDGRLDGALGVDYPAEKWIEAISLGRQRMVWFMAIPVLILGFGSAVSGALRAEIGARRDVESRLRESEAKLRTAIDNLPFDFWLMDSSGRYQLANATSRLNWGDCVGQTTESSDVPAEVRAMWLKNNKRAFAGEVVKGEVVYTIGGQRRHFFHLIAPVRVGREISGILGLNLDITDRVEAETARRKADERLAQHIRQTPLAVIEWDRAFKIIAWNPSAERIFGFAAEEAIGRDGGFIIPAAAREQVASVWNDLIAHRGGTRSTNENLTKSGRVILCEWYNTPLVDEQGQVTGIASHCQDVTERDLLEKRVRQAQKIESLGQLAGGVAHEFNNLLTPMLIQLDMLRQGHPHDLRLLSGLRSIENAIHQAAQLNQRILAVGRRSSEKRELLMLNTVVDDTISLLRHGLDRRVLLSLEPSTGMRPLSMDRALVSQIIVNLVINARDAVIERLASHLAADWIPLIEVKTAEIDARGLVPPGPGVWTAALCQRLSVIDNGVGMTPDVRARIFEPFFTTKAPGQGTGLGLALAWSAAQSLGGWIELQSEPGKGAAFHVYLPLPEAEVAVSEPEGSRGMAALTGTSPHGQRILLVEDNVLVAETMSQLLTAGGHEVSYAQNGEAAWRRCEHRQHGFDLVITDQNMPAVTGTELLRRLRAAGSPVRVLVISGHLAPSVEAELEALGVIGVLKKPFTRQELFDLIRRV